MATKQARSYQWVICQKCGASVIAARPCDVCRPKKEMADRTMTVTLSNRAHYDHKGEEHKI